MSDGKEELFCPECGMVLKEDDRKCPNCGTDLTGGNDVGETKPMEEERVEEEIFDKVEMEYEDTYVGYEFKSLLIYSQIMFFIGIILMGLGVLIAAGHISEPYYLGAGIATFVIGFSLLASSEFIKSQMEIAKNTKETNALLRYAIEKLIDKG